MESGVVEGGSVEVVVFVLGVRGGGVLSGVEHAEPPKSAPSRPLTLEKIGLLDYQLATGDSGRVLEARRGGEEYLLQRNLFRRLSTGEPFSESVLSLAHPRRAYYNVLAAADYFRAAALAEGTVPDPRMAEVVEQIRAQRRPDGTWLQGHRLRGEVWFHVDVPAGEPSKWVTHQATRVLDWWDARRDPSG